jgi:hypothetical protein
MMFPQIPFDKRILYFGRDRMQFGSHFHPAPVELDGVVWPSAEHFYQARRNRSIRLIAGPSSKRRFPFKRSGWRRIRQERGNSRGNPGLKRSSRARTGTR